jgi:hypothetical protein
MGQISRHPKTGVVTRWGRILPTELSAKSGTECTINSYESNRYRMFTDRLTDMVTSACY